jgi:hypothetical protein
MSWLSLSIIPAGVFFGAQTPNQPMASNYIMLTSCRWGAMAASRDMATHMSLALARISHTTQCIGAPNQRKLLCENDFQRFAERPDADRV